MLQRLLGLLALFGLGWALSRLIGGSRSRGGRPAAPDEAPAARMVRDRVCNTFLPRSKALTARIDDAEHFFCSERCKERFLSESVRSAR